MIPGGDNDRVGNLLCAQHFGGEFRVLFGVPGFGFQNDSGIRDFLLAQFGPQRRVFARARQEQSRRGTFAQKLDGTRRPFLTTATEDDDDLRWLDVRFHEEQRFGKEHASHQRDQRNGKDPVNATFDERHLLEKESGNRENRKQKERGAEPGT
jgi:hypothetical protein